MGVAVRIIGIDPSLAATGLAVIDIESSRVVAWRCIRTKPTDDFLKTHDFARRLAEIALEVRMFCAAYPGIIAVEGQVGASMGKASIANVGKLMAAYGAVIGALPSRPLIVLPSIVKKRVGKMADASKGECFANAMVTLHGVPAEYPSGGRAAKEAVEDAVCVALAAMPEVEQVLALTGGTALRGNAAI